jgi:hypothetical protein
MALAPSRAAARLALSALALAMLRLAVGFPDCKAGMVIAEVPRTCSHQRRAAAGHDAACQQTLVEMGIEWLAS